MGFRFLLKLNPRSSEIVPGTTRDRGSEVWEHISGGDLTPTLDPERRLGVLYRFRYPTVKEGVQSFLTLKARRPTGREVGRVERIEVLRSTVQPFWMHRS